MTHRARKKDGETGNKFIFSGCMMAMRDASYIVQSILVKYKILAYFSFLWGKKHIKRVCPFK